MNAVVTGLRKDVRMLAGGKYRLLEEIGYGGMAVVWRAQMRVRFGPPLTVAIKKMKAELHAGQNYIDMFVEEARVGGKLRNPHIVKVFDLVRDDDGYYCLVMEWVEGTDLRGLLAAGRGVGRPIPWSLLALIASGTLRGLAAAHERTARGRRAPIIHRDVSPSNVLLGRGGEVKLADFGLARAFDRVRSLTSPGIIKGKLAYLAPEITRGHPATVQSDLFSLGCVLWESLAGRPLYDGAKDLDVFRKAQNAEVRPLSDFRADVPRAFSDIVHRALCPDPETRFKTARSMVEEVDALVLAAGGPDHLRRHLAQAVKEACAYLAGRPPPAAQSEVIALNSGDFDPVV